MLLRLIWTGAGCVLSVHFEAANLANDDGTFRANIFFLFFPCRKRMMNPSRINILHTKPNTKRFSFNLLSFELFSFVFSFPEARNFYPDY